MKTIATATVYAILTVTVVAAMLAGHWLPMLAAAGSVACVKGMLDAASR